MSYSHRLCEHMKISHYRLQWDNEAWYKRVRCVFCWKWTTDCWPQLSERRLMCNTHCMLVCTAVVYWVHQSDSAQTHYIKCYTAHSQVTFPSVLPASVHIYTFLPRLFLYLEQKYILNYLSAKYLWPGFSNGHSWSAKCELNYLCRLLR